MSRHLEFDVTLREQEVTCYLTVNAPEPDVGIMGWQIDEVTLRDSTGNLLDWELTDEELDKLYDEMPDPEDNTPDFP